MSSSSSTCPAGNSIPDAKNLPIPQNISFVVIPGKTVTDPMIKCCAGNNVSIAEGCYEWCEIPSTYLGHGDSEGTVLDNFGGCLVANHRNTNESNIIGGHVVNGAGRNVGLNWGNLVVGTLLVSGVVLGSY